MASMRDIKRRRDSIQSTGQITKAMKLVSTVKLQKAKGKAESTKPYFDLMYDTVKNMLAKSGNINHKYLKAGDSSKKAIITITANRGLAGGYNSNITRLITGSDIPKEDALIYAIGTKEDKSSYNTLWLFASKYRKYSHVCSDRFRSDFLSLDNKKRITDLPKEEIERLV